MSAADLLQEIERLPDAQRLWLMHKILQNFRANAQDEEDNEWREFSSTQLAQHYAPEDSVYDND